MLSKTDYASLPRLALSLRQLCDLELIMNEGFAPLKGFLNENDYHSVVDRMRLSDDKLWPIPIVLDVPEDDNHNIGDDVLLCDVYGKPLAVMHIESRYAPDKIKEAQKVYGTTDPKHFGVRYLFDETEPVYLGGSIESVNDPDHYDFQDIRHKPEDVKRMIQENGWEKVIGFQTRNPIHRAQFELIRRSAKNHDAHVLVHPVVGMTKHDDIEYGPRVRSYKQLHEYHMKDFATLSLLPLAMRMAGPREALWHAIIRKNYGCTHFIVGRDHAGPGKGSDGNPYYGLYDAQDLVREHEDEIGINMIPMKEISYIKDEDTHLAADELKLHHKPERISGTEFRRMLRNNEEVPAWFSFPEVIDELRKSALEAESFGITVFFTGLSGAGKSTIARLLVEKLSDRTNRPVTYLDGDVIRTHLSKGLGFSKEDRDTNIERIGFVASEITKHRGLVICAAIAPYKSARIKNRKMINRHGEYIEVHVATPVEECKRRDVKGLYAKAERGEIQNFTGVNDPYEAPERPEIVLDTINKTPEECAEEVYHYLKTNFGI